MSSHVFNLSASVASDSANVLLGLERKGRWSGRTTTRLDFGGTHYPEYPWLEDAAKVYVEVIGKGIFQWIKEKILNFCTRKFVKVDLNLDGEISTVFVNVNSLSSRLGISKAEIYVAKENGTLSQFLEEAKNAYIDSIERAVTYLSSSDGTDESIQKVVCAASLHLDQDEVWFDHGHYAHPLLIGRLEGGLQLLAIQEVIPWNEQGGLCVAEDFSSDKRRYLVKFAGDDEEERLKREVEIVSSIFCNGIQSVNFNTAVLRTKNTHQCLYISDVYDSNLEAYLKHGNLRDEDVDAMVRDLTYGLHQLHQDLVVHGAISSSNCLVSEDDTGKCKAVIGGFGHAQRLPVTYSRSNELFKADVYAMGQVIQELVEGRPELQEKYQGAIEKMLLEDVSERPTMDGVRNLITLSGGFSVESFLS